ncbi:MAG: glycosyltransferase family 2 protein [Acidobacteriota bacterium]|nr:glycosyltransferase family 2 protein [Acidobacteriota bacterium]
MGSPFHPLQPGFWLRLGALLLMVPFDLLVALGLCLAEILYLPFSLLRRKPDARGLPARLRASLIVLNWDGKHLLEEFLPSVVEAVRQGGDGHEILVVDNGSRDDSVAFLNAGYPQVKVVALDRNRRFTGGNNAGVQAATGDVVVLLNNDMEVDPHFLRPLLDGFREENVFAVTSQVFFQDKSRRREETGNTKSRWRQGFPEPYHDEVPPEPAGVRLPVLWAGGGSSAFDRRKFLALGGLDTLYDPFYLEDVDLSYQAWKRGWKSLLASDSLVVHKHRGTNRGKFGDNFVDNTIRKNQYLFVWKSITDARWILQHCLFLPLTQARFLTQTNVRFELRAFFKALLQFPEALYKRYRRRADYRRSDASIFAETSGGEGH